MEKQQAPCLEKGFDPVDREPKIYDLWERGGCFAPREGKGRPIFDIAMPPPNANGELHLGHSLGYTVMDILGRFYRLNGCAVLLLPGKDHAGIQTQVVFEKKLQSEGLNPKSLGTDELYRRCYDFCIDRARYMRGQEKTLGLSADWERELFTLDPRLNSIVFETFVRMWRDGLVYRGSRIVNWSVFSQTGISDVEVEYKEQEGSLWYICYPLVHSSPSKTGLSQKLPGGGSFIIGEPGIVTATTRPETMLGDTALAVHPDDERYRSFVGGRVRVPLIGREIPIIADKRVDPSYGTGVIKVTPAHDFADFDIGIDHSLEVISVIGKDGLMTSAAGPRFQGLKTVACREAVVAALRDEGQLLDITPITHKVPIGERGKDIIEPLISEQWFVAVDKPGNSLKARALELLEAGRISIYPDRFGKLVAQWLESLRDWNISRQLWWGHRMPVWYRGPKESEEIYVGLEAPRGEGWRQETDVFDTWFSSGQWAFSTMAAHGFVSLDENVLPQGKRGEEAPPSYFPTHTMVMGRDILFFWACRMLLMTAYRMRDVPWRNIFFTGLIRDEHGQKMSKSKGNGIEPNDMIQKYGADSLRLAMVMGSSPGNDINFSERKVQGYHKFVHKLWNAARLIELKMSGFPDLELGAGVPDTTLATTRWILKELSRVEHVVQQKMREYELGIALDELYGFTWGVFCDWYLEMMKALVDKGQDAWGREAMRVAAYCFRNILTMLHPFIPFVTEELYQKLPCIREKREGGGEDILAMRRWEAVSVGGVFNEVRLRGVMEAIAAVRSIKAVLNIPHKEIRVGFTEALDTEESLLVMCLARVSFCEAKDIPEELALRKPFSLGALVCEVEGKEKYRDRLEKDIGKHRATIGAIEARLAGEFGARAAPHILEQEQEKLKQSRVALAEMERELQSLN